MFPALFEFSTDFDVDAGVTAHIVLAGPDGPVRAGWWVPAPTRRVLITGTGTPYDGHVVEVEDINLIVMRTWAGPAAAQLESTVQLVSTGRLERTPEGKAIVVRPAS